MSPTRSTPVALPSHGHLVAIDLGSNSFHSIIARLNRGAVQVLSTHKERVRLAAGLDDQHQLGEEAMARALATLKRMAERMQGLEGARVRIVATHSLRQARNRQRFLRAAEAILGYPVEIISGHEEARLIYQGVAHTEQLSGRTLVVDIGGGSTELALGEGFELQQLSSHIMGCVSFSERYFGRRIDEAAFQQARLAALQALEPVVSPFRRHGWHSVRATSGTAAALRDAVIALGHHDGLLTAARLTELRQQLIGAGHWQQIALVGISDSRKPVIAGGLAILMAVQEALGIDGFSIASAGLREGVLYEMDAAMRHHDIRQRTRASLMARYNVDRDHASEVVQVALTLWDQSAERWQLPAESRTLLEHAAWLHEVGLDINSKGVQRHSAYILANCDLPGFNQSEQQLLATLVRWHRKRFKRDEFSDQPGLSARTQRRLCRLLRLAVVLNLARQPGYVPRFEVKVQGRQMVLKLPSAWLANRELVNADLAREAAWLADAGLELRWQPLASDNPELDGDHYGCASDD